MLGSSIALARTVLSALAVTGLVVVFGDVGEAAADIAVGPGPTDYTAQQQPAPGACHYRTAANGQTLPDPNCTPGAISPKVTQDTLATTICRTGYTKSIRRRLPLPRSKSAKNAAAYGYTGSLKHVEYNHLLSGALAMWDVDCAGQNVGGMPLTMAGG